jgi:predicted glycoside hydrolase/deacetylase ChbG (UPF0249 family)
MPSIKAYNSPFLIINADDYGYFSSVSRGIIECARRKAITATSIMANGPSFEDTIEWLREFPELDIGVHLNITFGTPITSDMKACLDPYNGMFQNRMKIAMLILSKKIPVSTVIKEWRAQIARCISKGFKILFINSHEHMHMLPTLFKPFVELAREFDIPFIRFTQPEWQITLKFDLLFRNWILFILMILNIKIKPDNYFRLMGTGVSCQLNLEYLENIFKKMKNGVVYEFMCHPGYYDKNEIVYPELVRYHSWEEELRLLTGERMAKLLQEYNVKLGKFREFKNWV